MTEGPIEVKAMGICSGPIAARHVGQGIVEYRPMDEAARALAELFSRELDKINARLDSVEKRLPLFPML